MSDPPRLPSSFGVALGACAAIGLGIAISNGAYSLPAAICIAIALFLLGRPWLARVRDPQAASALAADDRALLLGAALGGIALAWTGMNDERLVLYAARPWTLAMASLAGLGLVVATYVPAIVRGTPEKTAFRHARFAVAVTLVLAGGADAIRSSPNPKVDVWVLEQEGADLLAAGKNPYTNVSVKNSAPGEEALPNVPYVYTPTQLFVTLPAKKLFGDVRYAMLIAVAIAGVAMRFCARRSSGEATLAFAEDAPALFYFLSPKLYFVLEQAWTEPISVMLASLALAAFVAKRRWALAVALGFLFSTKQTMIWIVPTAWVLLSLRPWQAFVAFGVAGATLAPFAAFDFGALKYALLDFQNRLPPRKDGLTLGNTLQDLAGFHLPGALGFVLAAAVCGVSAVKLRGKADAFAPTAAFTLLVFFFFNKWAFANYYFLTMGLAAAAAATSRVEASTC